MHLPGADALACVPPAAVALAAPLTFFSFSAGSFGPSEEEHKPPFEFMVQVTSLFEKRRTPSETSVCLPISGARNRRAVLLRTFHIST